jgi:aspartyl-tRNA(Asn)/glutamyl-tRNA(Gln) amidotransferase subunit A
LNTSVSVTAPSNEGAPPALSIAHARAWAARASHEALTQHVIQCARGPLAQAVYVSMDESAMRRQADAADAAIRARPPHALPAVHAVHALHALHGLPVSIKDLFDVKGEITAGGSVVRATDAPAAQDAGVITRLRHAGCVFAGRTSMSEFAFSGVGMNPHHGTPRNPHDAAVHRIPGGSSSGAAMSVALGLAVAGLGSDTGGSLRIPAALCGLVGFKPTQARVPRQGVLPLSTTLDSIGAITTSVRDAITLDAVLAGTAPVDPSAVERPSMTALRGVRLALPQTLVLDALDATVARAFERALAVLREAGAVIEPVALPALAEIATINAPGGLSAIEAYAVHREAFEHQRERLDPRVALRIAAGRGVSTAQHARIMHARQGWIERAQAQLAGYAAWVAPTVPMVAPALAPLLASDEAFFAANGLLLRNPFTVNFMDGCAISLPCHTKGELPVGLMLASTHGQDALVLGLALAVEAALDRAHAAVTSSKITPAS